jgi:hypothetical protein
MLRLPGVRVDVVLIKPNFLRVETDTLSAISDPKEVLASKRWLLVAAWAFATLIISASSLTAAES